MSGVFRDDKVHSGFKESSKSPIMNDSSKDEHCLNTCYMLCITLSVLLVLTCYQQHISLEKDLFRFCRGENCVRH